MLKLQPSDMEDDLPGTGKEEHHCLSGHAKCHDPCKEHQVLLDALVVIEEAQRRGAISLKEALRAVDLLM